MKRKVFLKLSSLSAMGLFLPPYLSMAKANPLKNWAGNITYSTDKISYPSAVESIRETVNKLPKVKALGTRHCFNRIADSRDHLIGLAQNNQVLLLDKPAKKVTVEGGINYGELSPILHKNGFALANLASLPHISVAGGIITATHGSGIKNGNLATAVSAIEFVAADGNIHRVAKDENPLFYGAVVNLGALGILTEITLDLLPTYSVKQYVYENMPLSQLRANFETIMGASYSVSLFTDWKSDSINEVWLKTLDTEPLEVEWTSHFFEAAAATKNLHPIAHLSAENCSEQMGVPGPWFDRLPHFRMGFMPSSGAELQSEYFVPLENGIEAINAIHRMGELISPHLFISEIRTIAADELWLSPSYRQNSVAIHFTWKQNWAKVSKLLPKIEKALEPFGVRPHWGKLFTLDPKVLRSRYGKFDEFRDLVAKYDPKGKFRNKYLEDVLG